MLPKTLDTTLWSTSPAHFLPDAPPLLWSTSSLIFSPSPDQPIIHVRHFSSSIHLTLPSPPPILNHAASYCPPTVISAPPDDEWLFAYFPGKATDGLCCLWKRGVQIDTWSVKECWSTPVTQGIVAASWAGGHRQLDIDSSGLIYRLPTKGPEFPPVIGPALLLVNQAHQLSVYFYRNYNTQLRSMSASLTSLSAVLETAPQPPDDREEGSTVRLCTKARIGFGYADNSFLVATRSHVYPSHPHSSTTFDTIDLTLDMDEGQSKEDVDPVDLDWDPLGEEDAIHITRVLVTFDGWMLGLQIDPLAPVHHLYPHLSTMEFISDPPKDAQPHQIYLAANYRDYGDRISCPKSEIVLYSTSRLEGENKRWVIQTEASRTFTDEVVDYLASAGPGAGLLVGILVTSGVIPRSRSASTRIKIGKMAVLRIPTLANNEDVEYSCIMAPADVVGSHLPLSLALSPNAALVCTTSPPFGTPQICVHALPRRKSFQFTRYGSNPVPALSVSLALALFRRQATNDVTHALSLVSVPVEELSDTLYYAISLSEAKQNGMPGFRTNEALGIVVESYRSRARQSQDRLEKSSFTARWESAHDICSLAACKRAFEDCRVDEEYDIAAVWELVGLCGWIVTFVERLLKECVKTCSLSEILCSDASSALELVSDDLEAPVLLHLSQPFALFQLSAILEHLKRFRNFLGNVRITTQNEHVQLARNTLTDLVECSGVDFNALGGILKQSIADLKNIGMDEGQRALAAGHPTQAMKLNIYKTIKAMLDKNIIDKSRLFIKPSDLVDGVSRLALDPLLSQNKKAGRKDVVTKAMLLNSKEVMQCLRCGGHSQVGLRTGDEAKNVILLKWMAWERTWTRRCICGGAWATLSM